jgi:hypothetical protein
VAGDGYIPLWEGNGCGTAGGACWGEEEEVEVVVVGGLRTKGEFVEAELEVEEEGVVVEYGLLLMLLFAGW